MTRTAETALPPAHQGDAPAVGAAPRSGRRLAVGLALGAWALLGASIASQNYAEYALAGRHVSFLRQWAWIGIVLSYWLLATPLIVRLLARFPFERGRLRVAVPVHCAAAVTTSLLQAPVTVAATALLDPFPVPPDLGFWRAAGFTLTYSFHTGLLLYAVVVGSGAAVAGFRRSRERQLQAARLEVELGEARLRALEAQIRPHFLFNALNTVAMQIRDGEGERATEMVARLGELLRESLRSAPGHEVRLEREIELASLYLEVERRRFADRMRVEIDVPGDLEDSIVPHLVLQPLVENAVRHGISRSPGSGLVRIAARREDDRLVLEVADDGAAGGAPGGVGVDDAGSGVGLENVRARLAQLYGPAASVSLERRDSGTTAARLVLPLRHASPPSTSTR